MRRELPRKSKKEEQMTQEKEKLRDGQAGWAGGSLEKSQENLRSREAEGTGLI